MNSIIKIAFLSFLFNFAQASTIRVLKPNPEHPYQWESTEYPYHRSQLSNNGLIFFNNQNVTEEICLIPKGFLVSNNMSGLELIKDLYSNNFNYLIICKNDPQYPSSPEIRIEILNIK